MALVQAVQTCTLGEEAWILVIGFHGNMRLSGSKGPEQVSVEVAGSETREVTPVRGFAPVTVTGGGGGGSVAAGIIVADGMLRLPLDDFWPGFHLAPYAFGGFGGIFLGSPNNEGSFDETFTVTNSAGVSREVTFKGRVLNKIQRDFPGGSQVLGHVGGGLEYRFTPHIGLFAEVGYVFPNLSRNNYVQINFGLRYAF